MKYTFQFFEILRAKSLKYRVRLTGYDESTGVRIKIDGLRVIDDGVKPPWVGLPQERYWLSDGSAKYKKLLDLNEEAKAQILKPIIEEYKRRKLNSEEGV